MKKKIEVVVWFGGEIHTLSRVSSRSYIPINSYILEIFL